MQRQSVEVLDLMTVTGEVVTSIETHGVTVAARLDEQASRATLRKAEGSESRPSFGANMFYMKDSLTASAQKMAMADERHVGDLATYIGLRQERKALQRPAGGIVGENGPELPPPRIGGVQLDPAAIAADLLIYVERLRVQRASRLTRARRRALQWASRLFRA